MIHYGKCIIWVDFKTIYFMLIKSGFYLKGIYKNTCTITQILKMI